MSRLAWLQLRFRAGRALALLAGMLVAATAFTVLTAAARTAQVRTIGTVSAHFRPAFDILVRPTGARSSLESATGTVQPDFLPGIYGGITLAQWHQIQKIAGVQVAAPIAMVGYTLMQAQFPVWLPAADVARPGRQLYRVSTTWVSANGATRIPQPASYVYVTPDRVHFSFTNGATSETLPGGSTVTPCPAFALPASPFSFAAQAGAWCWSKINGAGTPPGTISFPNLNGRAGLSVGWQFPMLIAAIDPQAEARLDGLNHAVTSGQYLPENYDNEPPGNGFQQGDAFPVLAATDSGIGEYALTQVQELPAPPAPPVLDTATMAKDAAVAGHTALSTTTTARQAYQYLLDMLGTPKPVQHANNALSAYWSAGPVSYRRGSNGDLVPASVRNPVSVWASDDDFVLPPMDNAGSQYRTLRQHARVADRLVVPLPTLAGTFSQGKIAAFDPLSRVPLGPYQPTAAAPANEASKKALGGSDLLPSLNLGGYVSQPVQLITTLAALPTLETSKYAGGAQLARAPVSVIRVRVAGVTGPDKASLNRIKTVAEQIEVRTHLTVDIVAGSSPAPATVALPAGKFGTPALLLTEDWIKKGVAITILDAVDRSSVTLFVLILVVCALFVANSATAAVRGRRQELGVLACLGWTRPRLFAAVLGEVALAGLAAGVLGALLSWPLAAALGLHASPARAALAIPVAMAVAVAAGAVPAALAARAEPVASVRPPVLAVRRSRQPSGITGLAVVNVLRTPGRTLAGALGLAVGVTALTLLIAVTLAFRGAVVGTLLGDVVTVQVRGVDYVAVAATVALGVLAVADALLISITERAPELAAIRAFGWPEAALRRLVITEGALTGIAGSLAGAALGLVGAVFVRQLPPLLFAAAAAAAVTGVLVTCVAALVPAHLLGRLPTAQLLAQERAMTDPDPALAAIELHGISKRYGTGSGQPVTAADDVSFTIEPGGFIALTGASGSGKSTLLHLIGAIERPDSGTIISGGTEVTALRGAALAAYRRTVGFVFQRYNLLPALTALDNVLVPVLPYRTGWDKPGRGRQLLEAVGLGGRERSLPARMSGGEQQRVAIARALINTPHVLLADEPTGNLDSHNATAILDLLARLRRENQMTVIIATHDPQIAARCDRLIRLRDGAVTDDIEIADGHPVDETIRRISQLG